MFADQEARGLGLADGDHALWLQGAEGSRAPRAQHSTDFSVDIECEGVARVLRPPPPARIHLDLVCNRGVIDPRPRRRAVSDMISEQMKEELRSQAQINS